MLRLLLAVSALVLVLAVGALPTFGKSTGRSEPKRALA
jgi:hypothetical protein